LLIILVGPQSTELLLRLAAHHFPVFQNITHSITVIYASEKLRIRFKIGCWFSPKIYTNDRNKDLDKEK